MVFKFMLLHALCDESQILDHLTDRYMVFVAENNARKFGSAALSRMCFSEKILVECHDYPAKFSRPIEQFRVGCLVMIVVLGSQHVDTPGMELLVSRTENMHIEIESDAHD